MRHPSLPNHRPAPRTQRAGVALVIVLAFVVLLTGLIVAYFSRSMAGRQLSNSSAGQTKAALLAQSATDIVVAGLKKEIAGGSTLTVVGPTVPVTAGDARNSNVYVPLTNANAVPVRFGTPAPRANPSPSPPTELIPNMVRRSVRGDDPNGSLPGANPIPSPAVPSLASAVNSATDAAIGGRKITPARWNSHYLIPRAANATDADSKPDDNPTTGVNFTAPDWVLVTRNGPAAQTDLGSGATALNNATPANANFVVGRYAYAVYDEGGLLDMNVAGYPKPITPAAATGFTPTQVSRKGSLALADLTQLPISSTATLSQSAVDSIVGWRNYAAANTPTGAYPAFTFSASAAANWFNNFASNNTTGFLKVYGGAASATGPTDQALLSRQALLRLRGSIGFSANALQYMGTFSRSVEQPSYFPDANRPKIVNKNLDPIIDPAHTGGYGPVSITPPVPQLNDGYIGNNDAVGVDDPANTNPINAPFLSIRVKAAFARYDVNKTPAVIGEPLVKRKFALSRLREIDFTATDTTTSYTDSTMPANRNHIYDWFGLKRTNPSAPWTYYHGSSHIMTLTEVASANREPDFAELLKAAINTGSLGKAGPNLHNDQGNYQYALDVSVDYQVLEIMANLIDQSDTDSYPTIITVNLPSPVGMVSRVIRGVEDLPYFYRYHTMGVVTKTPVPLLKSNDAVDFYNYDSTKALSRGSLAKTIYHCKPNLTLSEPGEGVMLFEPGVWNPHDAAPANGTLSGPRPTKFRVVAVTDDPLGQSPWITWSKARTDNDYYADIPDLSSPDYLHPKHAAMTEEPSATTINSAMTFSDNNGRLFREPTLLWRPDAPAGAGLTAPAGSIAGPYGDTNFGAVGIAPAYMGLCMGKTGLSFRQQISTLMPSSTRPTPKYVAADPTDPANKNLPQDTYFVFQSSSIFYGNEFPASSNQYSQLTFRLEYADPNDGRWVVYDEKYPDFHDIGKPILAVNVNDVESKPDNTGAYPLLWPRNKWANPRRGQQMNSFNNVIDPRTARFGVGTSSSDGGVYTLEEDAKQWFNTDSDAGNVAFGQSKYTVIQTQRPSSAIGEFTRYSNPGMTSDPGRNVQMRWFSGAGYSASNSSGGTAPLEYDSMFALNNPAVPLKARDNASVSAPLFYEDADGIARRGMAAYADTAINGTALPPGLPLYTSNTYGPGSLGVGTPSLTNINRPTILNRPLRSVGEMSYAFRGTPWKQIDFFTPESGDAALLDVFCANEPPVDGIVAGKVNLNTHQAPVLKALLAGTARDEAANVSGLPATIIYPTAALDSNEANAIAGRLVNVTTDATAAWRGPLANIAHLVGRYVPTPGDTSGAASDPDFYTFKEPASGTQYTYAGFSAALNKVYATSTVTLAPLATPRIQRFRESAIRALSDAGQTRVWNLLIDVVAQTGRYPTNATSLSQFSVDGEQRCWIHVAIDRVTGEVIDKQVEAVTE